MDALIDRDEFLDIWVMKWAELFQIWTVNGLSPKGLQRYDAWLRDRVRSGVTIDKIARELLPATGGSFENPAVSYYQSETDPATDRRERRPGVPGHAHPVCPVPQPPVRPLDPGRLLRLRGLLQPGRLQAGARPRELTVFNTDARRGQPPVAGRAVRQVPRRARRRDRAGEDYRKTLAGWLASPDNRRVRPTLANVVWSHFFGQGIVEPVDDVRISNPPSNPELLDALGRQLAGPVRHQTPGPRASATVPTSSRRPATTQPLGREVLLAPVVRRLRAEVLLDCITGDRDHRPFPGLPRGGRAVQIPDGRSLDYFLTTFGRTTRETVCSCEVKTSPPCRRPST